MLPVFIVRLIIFFKRVLKIIFDITLQVVSFNQKKKYDGAKSYYQNELDHFTLSD